MAMPKFHVGWFHGHGFSASGWNAPWSGFLGEDWARADHYVEMVKALERARFDCFIMEDSSFVPEDYGGSRDYYLRKASRVPKNDPVPLMAILGHATSHIGVVPTMSTSFYPPFLAARVISTIDHLTGGRAGCNLVTSTSDTAAQNFGLDEHYSHDDRYARAEEFVEVMDALWSSWEADAIVSDREADIFVEPSKVHQVDFSGKYFRSRGPLNTPRPPQGRPVVSQAGGSPAGRDFAARSADIMLGSAGTLASMAALCQDMRARVDAAGRPAEALKVLLVVGVEVVETEAAAIELRARSRDLSDDAVEARLAGLASLTGIDFSRFELDAPVPELTTNGQQGSLAQFLHGSDGRTLRELVERSTRMMEVIGTPDQVARRLGEVWEETGGGGFLISTNDRSPRKHVFDVTEGLAPAMQRLGLTRKEYASNKFRDNLTEF